MVNNGSSPKSFSEFVTRVLSSMSVTAWIPSTVLLAVIVLTYKTDAALEADPGANVVVALVAYAEGLHWNDLAVFVGLIIVANVFVQAFLFTLIRALEGYWGVSLPGRVAARLGITFQLWRRQRLTAIASSTEQEVATWTAELNEAQDRWQKFRKAGGAGGVDTESTVSAPVAGVAPITVPDRHVRLRAGATVLNSKAVELAKSAHAEQINDCGHRWRLRIRRWWARVLGLAEVVGPALRSAKHSELSHVSNEANRLLRSYPAPERIMPTRLGNCLRASEDIASAIIRSNGSQHSIEGVVPMVFGLLPQELKDEYDLHRGHLDLYAQLHLVFILIGIVVGVAFADSVGIWSELWVGSIGGVLVSNVAMCRAAESYGRALIAIASLVREVPNDLFIVPDLRVSPDADLGGQVLRRAS